jgi:PEP-CTERM motif
MRRARLALALATLTSLYSGSNARADLTLNLSNAMNADIAFQGNGSGATASFINNNSNEGFKITTSSGTGDSVGLFGTLAGTFSYTTASIVTIGTSMQSAPIVSSGGILTIADGHTHSLTASVTMDTIETVGVAGSMNVNAAINLTDVSYGGSNHDLTQLMTEADAPGGAELTISFQFVPAENLTQLAGSGADNDTSYSGTITALSAVPEPSSMAIAALGAVGLVAYGARRRIGLRGR